MKKLHNVTSWCVSFYPRLKVVLNESEHWFLADYNGLQHGLVLHSDPKGDDTHCSALCFCLWSRIGPKCVSRFICRTDCSHRHHVDGSCLCGLGHIVLHTNTQRLVDIYKHKWEICHFRCSVLILLTWTKLKEIKLSFPLRFCMLLKGAEARWGESDTACRWDIVSSQWFDWRWRRIIDITQPIERHRK